MQLEDYREKIQEKQSLRQEHEDGSEKFRIDGIQAALPCVLLDKSFEEVRAERRAKKVKTPLKAETKERTPLTKQNLSWNNESDYTSNEIKVVKTPRSAKKKNHSIFDGKPQGYRQRCLAYHKELQEERKTDAAKRAQMQNSL